MIADSRLIHRELETRETTERDGTNFRKFPLFSLFDLELSIQLHTPHRENVK